MINRQKLIEELLDEHCGYGDSNCERCAFDCLIRNVVEALSQPPADQWIPCSERLPKLGQICLVTRANWFGKPRLEIAGYWLDGWRIKGHNTEISAWMPLPEPYKGEQNDR